MTTISRTRMTWRFATALVLALALLLVGSRAAHATPQDTRCTGYWPHAVSNVTLQRAPGGTVAWGFKTTAATNSSVGPVVTVSMPFAYVNGRAINPPYGPHTATGSLYNFHGSINGYQYIGGGGGTIRTGDRLTLYWLVSGTKQTQAYRYLTCLVS